MKYYADCEFDGVTGTILSVALVSPKVVSANVILNKGIYLYAPANYELVQDQWVKDNVIPLMGSIHKYADANPGMAGDALTLINCGQHSSGNAYAFISRHLEKFFEGDNDITIVVDWPIDIMYISDLLITGPGTMINIPSIKFELRRVDAYPTNVKQAVQHNALWDAHMLMRKCVQFDHFLKNVEERNPEEFKHQYLNTWTQSDYTDGVIDNIDVEYGLNVFSCRAEVITDALCYLKDVTIAYMVRDVVMRDDDLLCGNNTLKLATDKLVQFKTNATLKQLKVIARCTPVADCHVIEETLQQCKLEENNLITKL